MGQEGIGFTMMHYFDAVFGVYRTRVKARFGKDLLGKGGPGHILSPLCLLQVALSALTRFFTSTSQLSVQSSVLFLSKLSLSFYEPGYFTTMIATCITAQFNLLPRCHREVASSRDICLIHSGISLTVSVDQTSGCKRIAEFDNCETIARQMHSVTFGGSRNSDPPALQHISSHELICKNTVLYTD